MRQYFKNVFFTTSAQFAAGVLAFLYSLFAARILGVGNYGLFQSLMALYAFSFALLTPISFAVVHCIGIHPVQRHREILEEFLRLGTMVGAVTFIAILIASPWISAVFRAGSLEPVFSLALLMGAVIYIVIFFGVLNGKQKFQDYALLKVVQVAVQIVIGGLLLLARPVVSSAIQGYAFSMAGIAVILLIGVRPQLLKGGFSVISQEMKSVIGIVQIFLILSVLDNAAVMAARIRLSDHESGLLGALYNLRSAVWPFATAIAVPFYTALIRKEHPPKRLLGHSCLLIGLLALGFIGAGFFFSKWFFQTLYGRAYLEAASYMTLYGLSLGIQMTMMIVLFYEASQKRFHFWQGIVSVAALLILFLIFGRSVAGFILSQAAAGLIYFLCFMITRLAAGRSKPSAGF